MDRICVQCGKRFTLSESELDFYTSKNLTIPKRCRECRKRNKDIGISPNNPELWSHSDVNRYNRYYVNNVNKSSVIISFILMVLSGFFALYSLLEYRGIAYILLSSVAFIFSSVIFIAFSCSATKMLIEEFDTTEYKHTFYDTEAMTEHYAKHGRETHSKSMEDYLIKANNVLEDRACKTKTIDNGDKLYYKQQTKEFVVVAKAGYIRTYFIANDIYYYLQ